MVSTIMKTLSGPYHSLNISYLTKESSHVMLGSSYSCNEQLPPNCYLKDIFMAWEIDPAHSLASFSAKHMMFTTVRGRSKVLSGQLHIDEQNLTNSSVDAKVDVESIDTGDPNRDAHLRSPDFFDAEKYPTLNFKSTKIEHAHGNDYNVTGDLTMHGVTHPVVF